jgi:hypothetical protein
MPTGTGRQSRGISGGARLSYVTPATLERDGVTTGIPQTTDDLLQGMKSAESGHLPTNRQTLKGRLVLKRSGPVPWQGIGSRVPQIRC